MLASSFFNLGSFSYTSRAGFIFIWEVSLTHSVLASFFIWGVSLTHPGSCWFISYMGSFCCTFRAGCNFIWGVSLTYTMLALFFCGEKLLRETLTQTVLASFLIWGVSLKHPVLASFLSGEFLLNSPCWLHFKVGSFSYTSRAAFILCCCFYVGSFSYTSRAGFIFIWAVSLTHPMLASF